MSSATWSVLRVKKAVEAGERVRGNMTNHTCWKDADQRGRSGGSVQRQSLPCLSCPILTITGGPKEKSVFLRKHRGSRTNNGAELPKAQAF